MSDGLGPVRPKANQKNVCPHCDGKGGRLKKNGLAAKFDFATFSAWKSPKNQ